MSRCSLPLLVTALALALAVADLQQVQAAARQQATQPSDEPDVFEASHRIESDVASQGTERTSGFEEPIFECGDEEVTELKINRTVQCKVSSTDAPRLFCYRAPQFNIWRAFCEVNFMVSSHSGVIPFVHSAAEDSLHGIIDNHVKAKRARKARDEGYILPETGIETLAFKRAVSRSDMIISPIELLTECPRPWAMQSQVCEKSSSPFRRSCISVSVPKSRGASSSSFTVTVTTKCNTQRIITFAVGALLLYLARWLGKSKVFCYSSGASLSVLLGAALLLVLILRRVKFPGAQSVLFSLMALGGYGMGMLSATGSLLRHVAVEYWEFVVVYLGVFALVGLGLVYRARSKEDSKESLGTMVVWSIRGFGVMGLVWSSQSGAVCIVVFVLCIVGIVRQEQTRSQARKEKHAKQQAKVAKAH